MEGRFKGGFFALKFGGLIFGGAYTLRGLFSEIKFNGITWSLAVLLCLLLVTEVEVVSGENLLSCNEQSEPRGSLGRLFDPNFCLFCPTVEPGPRLM